MTRAPGSEPLATGFFVVGGTLRRDAASYLPRAADRELHDRLATGEFCYVLTSRQTGKSSLMVRAAARLRAEGATAIVLDLTEVGRNLTVDQWYRGLAVLAADEVGLEDEVRAAWRENADIGPMQRWIKVLTQVILPRRTGRVVVFVDEIDAVRSLPFSTDEFFAGIRHLYNRRSTEPELARLTFCLLGVATPADLIRDTRTTPFNIGSRVEPRDFTPAEAAPLAGGLGGNGALLERVLYWTNGHPYLTQRLCQGVADAGALTREGVDRTCEQLFLSPTARERDDNLLFVRDRLLKSEVELAALLDLYRRVLSGARVADDDANPLVSILRLSGVTTVEQGFIAVRNRIYRTVFDRAWADANMPGAEVRRQRRAFKRGLGRAAAVAAVLVALLGLVAVEALRERNAANARSAAAESAGSADRRLRYAARMELAYEHLDTGDFASAARIVAEEGAPEGGADARGFEYAYLWKLFDSDLKTIDVGRPANDIAFSPDGTRLAVAADGGASSVVSVATGAALAASGLPPDRSLSVAFSPDGSRLAFADGDGDARVLDAERLAPLADAAGKTPTLSVAFSADGSALAEGDASGTVRVASATGAAVATLATRTSAASRVALSPDGKRAAVVTSRGGLLLFDVASGRSDALERDGSTANAAAFSPDGSSIAVGYGGGGLALWDATSGKRLRSANAGASPSDDASAADAPPEHGTGPDVLALAFSRDGRRIAIGTSRGTVEVSGAATLEREALFAGHRDAVRGVAWSPDGSTLASASGDGLVKIWSATAPAGDERLAGHAGPVYNVRWSPDGRSIASAGLDGQLMVWDASTGRESMRLGSQSGELHSVAWSPDGARLVSGGDDWTVHVWDAATGRHVGENDAKNRIFTVAYSPDGSTYASASFDHTVRVWDAATGSLRFTCEDDGSVESLAYSPDGRLIASGGESHNVVLWDASTGARVATLRGHTDWVNAVAFSPDGRTLASAGSFDDGTIRLWDVNSHASKETIALFQDGAFGLFDRGDGNRANGLAYSPDGRTLAAATTDGVVRLLDASTGGALGTLRPAAREEVFTVAFSPDGSTLATAGRDRVVTLWRAATRDEMAARR